MKKIFLFAAAAALLTACSSEELAGVETAQQSAADNAINFSVYTPRTVTRAGEAKTITTNELKTIGFGVLAYYTDDEKYDKENSKPNFMYNTKVTKGAGDWEYNPVMYWPNEYGNTAVSDNVDYVSFFAYAPYIDVENTTGIPELTPAATFDYNTFAGGLGITGVTDLATYETHTGLATDDAKTALYDIYKKQIQGKNITQITSNGASGDPIVKYVVDTNPKTSVDLLWGVAADETSYSPILGTNPVKTGKPFVDLVKPAVPTRAAGGILNFNMCHALSRLNVNIKYISDKVTTGTESEEIKANETRIYVRSIKIGGFTTKAALNLNSTETTTIKAPTSAGTEYTIGKPLWMAYDGKTALTSSDPVAFLDGRKDGKESMENGADNSEQPTGLNPNIVENYVIATKAWGSAEWAAKKTPGVTKTAVNLFGDGNAAATDPIFVIPTGDPIDIEIVYDVETADPALSTFLSDGITHGSIIKNTIKKTSAQIFTAATNMNPGYSYKIDIILGMTSVKFEAAVTDWVPQTPADVDLPDNQ